MFSEESLPRSALSVTVTRSAYLSHALVSFCAALPDSQRFDITYKEADLSRVMADVSSGAADLGVIRIPLHFERYYTEKLAHIIALNDIKSVTVVRMEVPCCGGIENATKRALIASGKFIPWQVVTISTDGKILE